jgi:hypothetical protein
MASPRVAHGHAKIRHAKKFGTLRSRTRCMIQTRCMDSMDSTPLGPALLTLVHPHATMGWGPWSTESTGAAGQPPPRNHGLGPLKHAHALGIPSPNPRQQHGGWHGERAKGSNPFPQFSRTPPFAIPPPPLPPPHPFHPLFHPLPYPSRQADEYRGKVEKRIAALESAVKKASQAKASQ